MGKKDSYQQREPARCGSCGGSGNDYSTVTDDKGKSRPHVRPCRSCGGSGKV